MCIMQKIVQATNQRQILIFLSLKMIENEFVIASNWQARTYNFPMPTFKFRIMLKLKTLHEQNLDSCVHYVMCIVDDTCVFIVV
jgi:hypothetical protein